MKSQKEQFALALMQDDDLLDLLGVNKAWWDDSLTPDAKYSIIPAEKAPLKETPYITVSELADSQVGEHLQDSFLLVRCYNADDNTFVSIDQVLSRVKALLHRHRFTFDGSVSIDTRFESVGTESEAPTFGQHFREAQYRLTHI